MQRTLRFNLILACVVAFAAGCGGAGSGRADVTPESMPTGGTFTGVWFSPQYGEMHMMQTGTAVVGEYTKDERRGRIQGNATGNLLRFEWNERRQRIAGLPSITRGRGYFRYLIDANGKHTILGEWGLDNSEIGGGDWNGYKLKNREPELSGRGSGGESGEENTGEWNEEATDDWGGSDESEEASGDESDDLEGLDL